MCDTCGIGPERTGSGISIFGKNSDREADETQLVVSVPSQTYPGKEELRCTYLTIPQAGRTFAMVLSKPFWLWGAEMGVNEKGVAIGNEALFTRVQPEKTPGLIGMDLLRLALERSATAGDAARIIIELLQKYGQAGPCGYRDKKFTYMNSFMIMDRQGMIKLETAGRDYALARAADQSVISNGITIARDWDASSLKAGDDFSKFSDPLITYFSGSAFRQERNQASILQAKSGIGATDVFALLRGHFGTAPGRGFNRDVCMHASDPLIRKSQTTGSLVVELHPDDQFRIFVTGGSAPRLSETSASGPVNMGINPTGGGMKPFMSMRCCAMKPSCPWFKNPFRTKNRNGRRIFRSTDGTARMLCYQRFPAGHSGNRVTGKKR